MLFEPSPPNHEDAVTVDGVLRVLACDRDGALAAGPGAVREVEAGGEEVLEGIILTKPGRLLLLLEAAAATGGTAKTRSEKTRVGMGSATARDGGLICCAVSWGKIKSMRVSLRYLKRRKQGQANKELSVVRRWD